MSSSLIANIAAQPPQPQSPASPDYWMPFPASTVAGEVDWLYDFIFWLSTAVSFAIFAVMILFAVRYRARGREENELADKTSEHNTALEITWSVIPLFLVIAIFVWGFKGYVNLRTVPKEALEVHVQAQKWSWLFTYPNGYTDTELHVPKDRDVRVVIQAVDVLHSLFIPAFRVKMDAVPGRYTDLWFNATEAGTYPIFCAEYCGTAHSDMLSRVIVHEPGGFEAFLEQAQDLEKQMPPAELGEQLYRRQGCAACHSVDGSVQVGPTWKGIFGATHAMTDGTSVVVDENYLREAILEPQARIRQGFPPSMPTYKGKLEDYQLTALIEYIKTLK
ncbi:MAG: cytochrome c oxidase subunit II [Myxococcales bacterium]|jgi:cytochrome c oxidase subunit 2|nr:cytochrome c oxidase subunit II [Myxococcales bacterium]